MEKRKAKIDRALCLIACVIFLLTGCGSEPLQKGLSSEVKNAAAQVLKAGFSMLLIGFGATDICAFGAKYMKAKKREQK